MCKPFNYENTQLNIAASIGSAVAPLDGSESGDLLEKADHAMYKVKRLRKQK
jgi:predicted signal transduction protein with EAL and GGDEF domain